MNKVPKSYHCDIIHVLHGIRFLRNMTLTDRGTNKLKRSVPLTDNPTRFHRYSH